jgi:aminoglycoside phosphotransferase (APT) family kinase protein
MLMTQLTEEVDSRVAEAVERALAVKVFSCERIRLGIVNRVYRVETNGGRFVVKVFRSRTWPEEGKLHWIERQLAGLGILHPRIVVLTRESSIFANGFMITEHVEGRDAWEAIDDGSLTTEQFCEQLGRMLRRVHSVRVKAYGYIRDGEGVHTAFIEQRLARTTQDVDQLAGPDGSDDTLHDLVRRQVKHRLLPFEHLYRPVLTHGDTNPHNCILKDDGQLALVDWDNAASSIWLRDYAHLTYRLLKDDEKNESGKDAFFTGYGATDLDRETIRRIEHTFHMIWDYNSLSHADIRSDPTAFGEIKERLLRRLSD